MSVEDVIIALIAGVLSMVLWSFVLRSRWLRLRAYAGRRANDRWEVEFIVPFLVMAGLWTVAIGVSLLVDTEVWGYVVRVVLALGPLGLFVGVAGLSAMQERTRNQLKAKT